MIVVSIQVYPGGNEEATRELARLEISNAENFDEVSHYDVVYKNQAGRELGRGVVKGHVRSKGFGPLLARALIQLGLDR